MPFQYGAGAGPSMRVGGCSGGLYRFWVRSCLDSLYHCVQRILFYPIPVCQSTAVSEPPEQVVKWIKSFWAL